MPKSLVLALLGSALLLQSCGSVAGVIGAKSNHSHELMDLYRASRHLDAAIATGVTYEQYATGIADAATSLLIAQDLVQGTDTPLLDEYRSLLQKHQDALYIWGLAIHNGQGDDPRLLRIQQAYGISPDYNRRGNMFVDLRDQLWQKAMEDEKKIVPVLLAVAN